MTKRGYERGSSWLGATFLLSVFGPMAILAILWALAPGVGESGAMRDTFTNLMIWVLLPAGVILIVEELVLIAMTWLKRPEIR